MNPKQALLLGSVLALASAAGVLLARAATTRRLHRDVTRLLSGSTALATRLYCQTQLEGLPAPVQRYFRRVLREGQPYLRTARLREHGQFKPDLRKNWVLLRGEQYITARPPGFIWQGTTTLFTARDEYRDGQGQLSVRLLGAVPVQHGEGPHYDEGELLRWLTESVLMPTNLLPGPDLAWLALNDHSARLLCRYCGQVVACTVRFNAAHEIEECEALRHQDGNQLRPWIGRFGHYRDWHGLHVPTHLEASWVINGSSQPYARFTITDLEYDQLQPF